MKKITAAFCTVALLTTLTGCAVEPSGSVPENGVSVPESPNSPDDPESAPQSSNDGTAGTDSSPADTRTGEPTFLIGLDGKAILTTEITRLDNTDKTAETLTPDDEKATVYCEGFTYLKEPTGAAFNSYENPELFDGLYFLGEYPENTNEWRRINVGDKICGLTVSKAVTAFEVNTLSCSAHFPEQYCVPYADDEQGKSISRCEFDGTVTMEGFLTIHQLDLYSDDGEMVFTPAENKLPIILQQNPNSFHEDRGFSTQHYGTLYVGNDFCFAKNETSQITFQNFDDVTCDMNGLAKGDTAYVRATFDNIKYFYTWPLIEAQLCEIELISDVLEHKDADTELRNPAPTR